MSKGKGRPRLPDDQAKRASFTTRLRGELKAKLEEKARLAGRSLSEEIEFRLELSILGLQHTPEETTMHAEKYRDPGAHRCGTEEADQKAKERTRSLVTRTIKVPFHRRSGGVLLTRVGKEDLTMTWVGDVEVGVIPTTSLRAVLDAMNELY